MNENRIAELAAALTTVPGVAGREEKAAAAALELLAPLGPTAVTPLGSVYCTVCTGEPDAPHILLEAHLDQIGMVVAQIEENGFLRIGNVGGFDRRTLPAAPVTIHAEGGDYPGVICSVPPHLAGGESKPLKYDEFAVDTGYDTDRAKQLFFVGDSITLDSRMVRMGESTLAGGAFDNRMGCVAVLAAAEQLKKQGSRCKVTVLLSSHEEVGGQGAATACHLLRPDIAVAVDVSFAEGFGAPAAKCGKLEGGVMIGIAPVLDHTLTRSLQKLAADKAIAWQPEVMGGRTGTDADNMAVAAGGVRTTLLSIPLRNMHTCVETVRIADVLATAQLMVAFVKEGGL